MNKLVLKLGKILIAHITDHPWRQDNRLIPEALRKNVFFACKAILVLRFAKQTYFSY
jgi:hypothetical protein